nr:secreted RxLR effector protein 161-like [Nicotiana tomentosiformis]
MGDLTFFLGLQIQQSEEGMFACQTKYTKELIQKFGMSSAKAIGIPMSPSTSLDKDGKGNSVNETKYHGMIGSLLYLTASRPDIMFSVCKCARFLSVPKELHLTAVKRIIRYLIGTASYGLWYPHSNNFKLEGFSDADLAGDKEDRKITSGTCQLLGKALISWNSKKQGSVALSTMEAEYIAIGQCCAQLLWMSHQLGLSI